MTFCPDCGKSIPSDLFVAHRAMKHPPQLITLAPAPIASAEAFGNDPKE